MASARFTFLGTGSSGGVPRVGNDWGACDPTNPRNRRRRCCALIDAGDLAQPDACTRILIDASPDLREQLLDAQVHHLNALVFSHDHADQSHGIDDVRALALHMRRRVPTYMDQPTAATLVKRFEYCFEGKGGYPAILDFCRTIEPLAAFDIPGDGGTVKILPLRQQHGRIESLGFRSGSMAYCNDVHELPPETVDAIRGVDTLVVDALRYTPHPSHAHLEQALSWIDEISPKQALLTNLHVDMDYDELKAQLPSHVAPAYDGLSFEFDPTPAF